MNAAHSSETHTFETLLRAAIKAAQSGNPSAARALGRALAHEYPDDIRAWLMLARVGETRAEQRAALERALVIDPEHVGARQALERLGPLALAAPPAALADPPAAPYAKSVPLASRRPQRRWLALAVVALVLLPTLGYAMTTAFRAAPPQPPAATPTLVQAIALAATPAQPTASATASAGLLSATQSSATTALPTAAPLPTVAPLTAPSPSAPLLATTALTPGARLEFDGWRVSLLQPGRTLLLDGAIGDLQPQGRFVLALVALANTHDQPRRAPANLFRLTDAQGHSYAAAPALSTAYLAAYGRAQRGDLSLEDALPAGGGYFSVPVLFDVPPNVQGLRLALGDGRGGTWSVPDTTP